MLLSFMASDEINTFDGAIIIYEYARALPPPVADTWHHTRDINITEIQRHADGFPTPPPDKGRDHDGWRGAGKPGF